MEDEAWKRERIAQFQGSSPTTAGGEVVSDDHHGGGESAKRTCRLAPKCPRPS